MRFYTLKKHRDDTPQVYVMLSDGEELYSLLELGFDFGTMNQLICSGVSLDEIKDRALNTRKKRYSLEDMIMCAPIPRPLQDVICLGLNYAAHAAESKRFKKNTFDSNPVKTVYFSKRVNEAVPDRGAIPSHRALDEKLDYEVELAVILKKDACCVAPEDAWEYIFGYTIVNDVSARDLQTSHKQWYFGKSLEGFLPMGPCIVTEDEFSRPPHLNIRSYVNGELRQNSNTRLHITDIPEVIAELSSGMTLLAGSIISMGTPEGVGMGMDPPTFLKPGDIVRCEIETIGFLTNIVKEQSV